MTPPTPRGLNRALLGRQLLLDRADIGVNEAVRRIVAIQAQEPVSAYLALWSRIGGFNPADLDRAFLEASVVKGTLMRVTLHAVDAADRQVFRTALRPTVLARLTDPRFVATGLNREQLDDLVPAVLGFLTEPRTNAEVHAFLTEASGVDGAWVWWALRLVAPVRHLPTGGPWAFGLRPSYVADGDPISADPQGAEQALGTLILRYLSGFGPATVADVARFTLVHRARVKAALAALGERIVWLDRTLIDLPDGLLPDPETPAPARLLAMWDSTLMAHADRARMMPVDYRKLITRTNGDTLATVLVDGSVRGVWRPVGTGIEVSLFERAPKQVWDELATEAASLSTLLADRQWAIHTRYQRWWDVLPTAQVRVL